MMGNVWIYAPKATPAEMQTNGIGPLEASSATVHEELNGEFSISLTVQKSSRHADAVVGGAVVKAATPRGPQFFRLTQPSTTEDATGGSITAYGWHISYDLAQDIILDRYWAAKTGAEALPDILQAGITERRFTGASDISLVTNMRVVRTSVLAALIGDGDNTFLKRWGGEIERDNFTVNMLSRLGAETGVQIRYRKNLAGLTLEENHDDIVNRVVPVGRTATDMPLLLPEVYIDSPRIDDTPVPHVRELDCADVQVGAEDADGNVPYPDEETAYTEMRARVAAMYAAGADLPAVTAQVAFVDLAKTEEYKSYAALEEVHLGDTIRCVHEDYGVDLAQRVVAYDYDALTGRYINITIGTVAPSLGTTMYAQDLDLSALKDEMDSAVKVDKPYNEVYINHEDGFVAESTIDGQKVTGKFNASGAGWYDNTGKMIGGMAVVQGLLAMIAGVLTDNKDANCYARIGEVELDGEINQGIFVYRKDISTEIPALRIIISNGKRVAIMGNGGARINIYDNGTLAYRDNNGTERLSIAEGGGFAYFDADGTNRLYITADGNFIVWDAGGTNRMWLSSTDSFIRAPGATNHAIGADTTGPYRVKNGVKTYF